MRKNLILSLAIAATMLACNRSYADTAPATHTIATATPRSASSVRAFRKDNPCPATRRTTGACPNYVVDHGIPLCAGGADESYNMYWQKSDDSYKKDADERDLCSKIKHWRTAE